MQADLADFQKLSRYNKGYRYLLVGVECLSRRAFAAPVKNKKAPAVKEAFKSIFAEMPALPWKIFTDRGMEFDSKEMKRFYEEHDIIKLSAKNVETKAAMAERMIKTLKHRLYKYFTQNSTLKWVDAVPRLVAAINNSICRATGLRPVDFNFENSDALWRRIYGPDVFASAPAPRKFKRGSIVRMARDRKAFAKGYLPTFSNLTYRIRHVKAGTPRTYILEDAKARRMPKKLYAEQLTRAAHEPDAKIEKVLRTRTDKQTGEREYLIKWEGEPLESASWITHSDIQSMR